MKKINCAPDDYYTVYLQQKSLMLHDQRIKNVQPTLRGLNNSSVRSSMHIKKQPLAELNRLLEIEVQNKALLKKLTDKTKSTLSHSKSHKLIKNNRKKNYEDHERNLANQGMAKRLKEAKSSYLCSRFAEDRRKTERFLQTRAKNSRRNLSKVRELVENSKNERKTHCKQNSWIKENSNLKQVNSVHEVKAKNGKLKEIINLKNIKVREGNQYRSAFVNGVVWENSCILEISLKNEESVYKLSLATEDFESNYEGSLQNLVKSIFHDKEKGQLLLLPANMNGK